MKKIYLDTSVPSNYYDTYPVEQVEATFLFWHKVLPKFKPYISKVVLDEINDNPHRPTREKLNQLLKEIPTIEASPKIEEIAEAYKENNVIPERFYDDALHIASATFHQIDYLVTWNMKHIAGEKQRVAIARFNESKGLYVPVITTPKELNQEHYEQQEE